MICPRFSCLGASARQYDMPSTNNGEPGMVVDSCSSSQKLGIGGESPCTAPATHGTEGHTTPNSNPTVMAHKRNSSMRHQLAAPNCGESPKVTTLLDGEGQDEEATASPSPAASDSGVDEKRGHGDSGASVEASVSTAAPTGTDASTASEGFVGKPPETPTGAEEVASAGIQRPGTSEVNRTLYLDPSSTPKSQNGRAMLKQRRARSVSSSGSMDHATSENVLSPSMKQHHRRRSGGSVPGNGTGAGFATAVDATSSSVSSSRVSSRNPSPASSGSWRRVGGWVGGGGGGIITPRASSLGSSSAGGFGSASKVKSPLSSSRLSADGVFVASRRRRRSSGPAQTKPLVPVEEDKMEGERRGVLNADMPQDMQTDAMKCAARAIEQYELPKDIAAVIKKEFDEMYGSKWHCIVGSSFGSFVTHEHGYFVYFHLGKIAVLLFKAG